MATRFEVLVNGKRVCTAGIDGDGVLTAIIDYAKRRNEQARYNLHVGGLGNYQSADARQQHVSWQAPDIGVGDEITIRILPSGTFDSPEGLRDQPSASIDDPLFGRLDYGIDAWNGEAAFNCLPFRTARLHLRAPETGPSNAQRRLFREFIDRHDLVWPQIAASLVRRHEVIKSVEELLARIKPQVCIDMDRDARTLDLTYSVSGDAEYRAYFVKLRDWEIVEIVAVE